MPVGDQVLGCLGGAPAVIAAHQITAHVIWFEIEEHDRCPALELCSKRQNFGAEQNVDTARTLLRRAFDRGVFHFDLANNYGPPPGHAEALFGRIMVSDLAPHRNEIVVSTKAGYDMWPGPFGSGGSRKYLLASLDDSLRRMGLDHVDIFYSHRFDPDTPLEETMSALASAVRWGKATHVGVSSYSPAMTVAAAAILRDMGVPLLIHQPSYSMFNRWIEDGLLDTLADEGIGCIAFSPLAQGLLTSRYLNGVPAGSRATQSDSFDPSWLDGDILDRCRALDRIATSRGQTLAQMAIAWVLRDTRVTSALVGASSVEQLDQNLDALDRADFGADELAAIDESPWTGGSTSGSSPGSPADVSSHRRAHRARAASADRHDLGHDLGAVVLRFDRHVHAVLDEVGRHRQVLAVTLHDAQRQPSRFERRRRIVDGVADHVRDIHGERFLRCCVVRRVVVVAARREGERHGHERDDDESTHRAVLALGRARLSLPTIDRSSSMYQCRRGSL